MNTWFDHILFHTRAQPETPALVMEDRVVTYGMLGVAVERCAMRIAALDLPGEVPVSVVVGNPIRHLAVCLGLFRCGLPSLSLEPSQLAAAPLPFAAALGDEDAKPVADGSCNFIVVGDDWFAVDTGAQSLPPGFSGRQHVCRLSLTSGSTGEPKIVRFSIADIDARSAGLMRLHWSRLLCLPGLSTAWGFWTACATLGAGATLFFSASPFQSVRMIELFAVDCVMAATEQLVALTRVARRSKAHLSSLRLVEIGGGVPTRALLEGAMMHVCREIYCRYGASESGAMARTPARSVMARPGLAGHILPGVEIAIMGADGNQCPAGSVGLVRARRSPAQSDAAAAWIDLGDIGWLSADGELFVIGRAADLGSVDAEAARRTSPALEAEHLLRLEWNAADAAAVVLSTGADGRPHIGIGTVGCRDADARALEAMLRARGIDSAVQLIPLASIPRGVSGKVNRAELRRLLAQAPPAI